MVCVNFRITYEKDRDDISQFFKNIGYKHRGVNKKSLKLEDQYLISDEFIRKTKKGRYHLFIHLGEKYSGTESYPQAKIFAHFDIRDTKKKQKRHFPDLNEKRIFREIYRIEKEMVKVGLGFLEEKDRKCVHGTIRIEKLPNLLEILNKEYVRYDKGKFRRRFDHFQIVINVIEQDPYVHLVLVYANISNKVHKLLKMKAKKEFEKLLGFLKK
ncbi:MAG: hypothetical protein ACOC1X_00165 [Promethearchaeota archaeon]